MAEIVEVLTEVKMEESVSTRTAEEDAVSTRRAEEEGMLAGGDSTKLEVLDETECLFLEPVSSTRRFSSRLREAFLDSIKCKVCGESFTTVADLMDHLRSNAGRHGLMSDQEINVSPKGKPKTKSKGGQFKCDVCDKTFSSTRKLLQHKVIHSMGVIKCTVCSRAFLTLSDLHQHKQMHSKENVFDCDMCDKAFQTRSALFNHQSTMHIITTEDPVEINGNKKITCRYCDKAYKSLAHLREHERVHTNEKPFACVKCGKAFHRGSSLNHHMKVHSRIKTYPCVKCGTAFKSYFHLSRHKQFHKDRKFSCDICKKMYATKAKLRKHSSQHKKESLICDECNKKFKTKLELSRHKRIHKTVERRHMCGICNKSYKQASHLKKHKLSHRGTSKKPHACRFCQKSFGKITQLNLHLQTHAEARSEKTSGQSDDTTQENKYNCGICSSLFETYYRMRKHKQMHKDKPYMCDSCEETFLVRAELRRHKQSECSDGYDCETCNKSFSTQHALQSHSIQHALERPYMCSVCHASFKTTKQLKRHMQVHMEEKIHTCSVCDKEFAQKSNLKRHKQICSKNVSSSSLGKTHTNGARDSSPSKSNRSRTTGGDRLKCSSCKKIFKKVSDLKEHEQTHITQSHHLCDIRGEAFKGKQLLRQHSKQHRKLPLEQSPRLNKQLRAHEAGRANTEMTELHTQLTNLTSLVHVDSQKNQVSEFVLPSGVQVSGNLNLSIETHAIQQPSESGVQLISLNSNAPVDALNANQQFLGLGTAGVHQPESSVSSPDMMCPFCNKVFRNSLECELHMSSHDAAEPSTSNICREALDALYSRGNQRVLTPFVYHNNDALNNPQNYNNTKKVAVENSGSVSDSDGDFGMPDLSDEDDEPHVEMCCTEILNSLNSSGDPDLSSSDRMVVHQLLPRVKKCRLLLQKITLFTCDVCDKSLQSQELLDQHRTSHVIDREQPSRESFEQQAVSKDAGSTTCTCHCTTKARKSTCEICSKQFHNKYKLQRHLLSHSKAKPHKCDRCGKTYKQKSHMKAHQRVSCKGTEDGTTCTPASKQTSVNDSNRDSKEMEKRTTQKEKNESSKCAICSKNFKLKFALQRHVINHLDERRYKCDKCDRTYKYKHHMKQHQRKSCGGPIVGTEFIPVQENCKDMRQVIENIEANVEVEVHRRESYQEPKEGTSLPPEQGAANGEAVMQDKRDEIDLTSGDIPDNRSISHREQNNSEIPEPEVRISILRPEERENAAQATANTNKKTHQLLKCRICSEEFVDSFSLQMHFMSHSDTLSYRCDNCGRCYKHKHHMKAHQKYSCRGAKDEMAFPQQPNAGESRNDVVAAYVSTQRRDSGKTCTISPASKITKCSYCLRWFHTLNHLLKHEKFHCTKRKYNCECGEAFVEKAELSRHRASHDDSLRNANSSSTDELQQTIHPVDNGFKHASEKINGCEEITGEIVKEHMDSEGSMIDMIDCSRAAECTPVTVENTNDCAESDKQSLQTSSHQHQTWKESSPTAISKTCEPAADCKICVDGFTTQESLYKHLGCYSAPTLLKCEKCSKAFMWKHLLKKHQARPCRKLPPRNENGLFECQYCLKRFQYPYQIERHENTHSDLRQYKCDCGETFKQRYLLRRHQLKYHGGKKVESDGEGANENSLNEASEDSEQTSDAHKHSPNTNEIVVHQSKIESVQGRALGSQASTNGRTVPDVHKCEVCSKEFAKRRLLVKHAKSHADDRPYSCKVCGKAYQHLHLLRHHKRYVCRKRKDAEKKTQQDEVNLPLKCHCCFKSFQYPYELERHENTHFPDKKYKCGCGKAFKQKYELTKHRNIMHTGTGNTTKMLYIKLVKCDVCFKNIFKSQLNEHMKCHSEEHRFICNECGKRYKNEHHMKQHKANNCKRVPIVTVCTDKRPYKCDKCKADFTKQSMLIKHQYTAHDLATPGTKYQLKCQLCPKTFNFEFQLERHKKVHFSGREYKCVCGRIFKMQLMLWKHLSRDHVTPPLHSCNSCVQMFSSRKFLRCHIRKQHDTRSFKCHKCSNTFLKSKHLIDHRQRVHKGKRRFKCASCRREFMKWSKLVSHELSHKVHTETASCELCGKRFKGKQSLSRHKLMYHPGDYLCRDQVYLQSKPNLKCDLCSKTFWQQSSLARHSNISHHKIIPYKCVPCNKTFLTFFEMKAHEVKHSESFTCTICNAGLENLYGLRKHCLAHIRNRDFICEICGKGLASLKGLRKHQVLHIGKSLFICEICNGGFKSKADLDAHVNTHNIDEMCVCDVCGTFTSSRMALMIHMKSHGNDKQLECETCGKGFHCKRYLLAHLKIHSEGAEEHYCTVCGKSFLRKCFLKMHLRSHQDKQRSCKICKKVFKRASCLTTHMLYHNNVRPYSCKFCDRTFFNRRVRDEHHNIHTKEKPYKCEVCGDCFASTGTLYRHKKVHEKKTSKWERDRLLKAEPKKRKKERSVKEEPKKRKRKAKR